MNTAPQKRIRIQTPGDPQGEATATVEPMPPEVMAEQLAQLTELTAQQAEELQAIRDAQAAAAAETQGGKIAGTHRVSTLTQDEAMAQARARGRAVLSRDGWVCPPSGAVTPAQRAAQTPQQIAAHKG